MQKIQMLDLKTQYKRIKPEIDDALINCLNSAEFINGNIVKQFANNLAAYLQVKHVIPCANGTDALQIAMMALGLKEGDEVIVPAFTYVAPAEAAALLKITPVFVDVEKDIYNINVEKIRSAINHKTKAIVAVHLFGQSCDMESIMKIAEENNLFVIEDNAQAIGCRVNFANKKANTGTIGHINCTSFFPSKNLGGFGDGGAITTNNDTLAEKARMIANHGQKIKYLHEIIGINSRLDSLQAAVLDIKLKHLDEYISKRQEVGKLYDELLKDIEGIEIPERVSYSDHVFHQYTIKVKNNLRDPLKTYLQKKEIPAMIYYPLPIQEQKAYQNIAISSSELTNTVELCKSVLSLPMHTELDPEQIQYIASALRTFFI